MGTKTRFPATGGYDNAFGLQTYGVGAPTGNVFFVSSLTGTNTAGFGFSPDAPFASIQFANTQCVAGNDDLILAMPGHVETLTAAASLLLNVAGVTVRGLGVGRQRPTINYTTAVAASCDVTAAHVVLDNLTFTPLGFDAITAAINVTGADFVMQNCEVEFANATNQAVLALLTAATATRMTLRNNHFHGSADAGTAAAIRHVAGADVRIENNIITGNFTTTLGGIDNTAAVAGLQIHGNVINNLTASAAKAFVWHASTTGVFSNNRLGVLTGTAPVTAAAGTNGGGNYYSAAAGVAAGTLL